MDWDSSYTSGEYRKHWDSSHASPELVGFISSLVNQEAMAFLDIGCGSGEDAIYASGVFRSSVGIDISKCAIDLAKEKCNERKSNAVFRKADIFSLPFGNSSFSIAADRGCLHNIPLNDWPSYEREVHRILGKEGVFLLRGARKVPSYADNFSFIEPENVGKFFTPARWDSRGPYKFTMFSDAEDGYLLSNLFVLSKL